MTAVGQEGSIAAWTASAEELQRLPVRRRSRKARRYLPPIALLVVVISSASFLSNEALEWPTVASYMFAPSILSGVWLTIRLTLMAMFFGLLLAAVIAAFRLSGIVILEWMGAVFVWFFRAVPLLVLLVLMFNVGLMYPRIVIGLPFLEPLIDVRTADIMSAIVVAVVAFSLYEAAYGSEVLRSALMAVPDGQREAGIAMGMTGTKVFRRVIFPQAMRVATPLLANQFIQMTKNTSVVAFIAVPDLLYSAQLIYSRSFEVIPLLLVATIWYLILVTLLTFLQTYLERKFGAHDQAVKRTRLGGRS